MLYLYSSVLEMKGGLRRDAIIGVQILTMQPVDANYGVPTMGLNAAAVAPLFPFPFSLFPLPVKLPFIPERNRYARETEPSAPGPVISLPLTNVLRTLKFPSTMSTSASLPTRREPF